MNFRVVTNQESQIEMSNGNIFFLGKIKEIMNLDL